MQAVTFVSCPQPTVTESLRAVQFCYFLHGVYVIKYVKTVKTEDEKKKPETQRETHYIYYYCYHHHHHHHHLYAGYLYIDT